MNRSITRSRLSQKGFTLIELLIALAIGSIAMGATVLIFKHQSDAHNWQEEMVQVEQSLRSGMEILIKDLRMGGMNLADLVDPLDDADGGVGPPPPPDAMAVRRTTDDGLKVVKYQGAAAVLSVCTPSNLEVGQILFTVSSDRSEHRSIVVTQKNQISCTECVGDCDKINFNSGLSALNSPGGLGADFDGGDIYGLSVNSYFIKPDTDPADNIDDSALMRINNSGAQAEVAFGINDLQIFYILNDGTRTPSPVTIDDVRMIEVTLNGITRHKHKIGFGGTPTFRTKSLTTTIKARNLGL